MIAGLLFFSSIDYQKIIAPVTKNLIDKVKTLEVPVIYYPGQGSHNLHCLQNFTCDAVALDWRNDLSKACEILDAIGLCSSIQGNLDPQILFAPKHIIEKRVYHILDSAYKLRKHKHIFNVGHGLIPGTPIEGLETTIASVRKWQKENL